MIDDTHSCKAVLIRIVIGRTSGGLYWDGIKHLLQAVSEFRVTMLDPHEDLVTALNREHPQILIVQVQPGVEPDDYQELLSCRPGLAVIALDPSGTEHVLRLHEMGHDLLINIIREIGVDEKAMRHRERFLLITENGLDPAEGAPATDLDPESSLPPSLPPYRTTAEHLRDFFRWLDLVLLGQLAGNPACYDEAGSLGWTMHLEKARALLAGDRYRDATAEEYRRAREDLELIMRARVHAVAESSTAETPKLVALARIFKLDQLEWLVLVIALAPELDGRYARVFGYLNDDLSRKRPTASLIAHMLPGDTLRAWRVQNLLRQDGKLAEYQLLTLDPEEATRLPGSEVGLVPAPELVALLLAADDREPHYMPAIRVINPPVIAMRLVEDAPTRALREALEGCVEPGGSAPLIHLQGSDANRCWFERVVGELGYNVVRFDVARLPYAERESIANAATAAARVALIHNAVLLITGFSRLSSAVDPVLVNEAAIGSAWPLVAFLANDGPLSFSDIATSRMSILQVDRSRPPVRTRAALWSEEARRQGIGLEPSDAGHIARRVGFDEPEIAATLSLCGGKRGTPASQLTLECLQAAARQVARQGVPPMVRRVEAVFTWSDIVLPVGIVAQLKQIPLHVSHAENVLQDWGFAARLPYGQGVAALFSGPSGTGKTMAAQIIARELGVELFQVDLAKAVSKYIGETEKNLDLVFDAAERSSAVLLFDEADSLFGKRSEVKDAHDRYANVEVAYLLQRMEAYAGVAILTTNMKQNLDPGFIRRLRFFIDFPTPNAEEREQIWLRSFPQKTPVAKDVDFTILARRLAVTGGHIQQIAVRAAFTAAAEGHVVGLQHILEATRQELMKLGMLNAERSLADLAA